MDDDDLNPARGIVIALVAGGAFWAGFYFVNATVALWLGGILAGVGSSLILGDALRRLVKKRTGEKNGE